MIYVLRCSAKRGVRCSSTVDRFGEAFFASFGIARQHGRTFASARNCRCIASVALVICSLLYFLYRALSRWLYSPLQIRRPHDLASLLISPFIRGPASFPVVNYITFRFGFSILRRSYEVIDALMYSIISDVFLTFGIGYL